MSKRISINEVAAAAGVSRATAARALSGTRNVAPSIVESVKRAATDLGYQRNALASSLRSQKTHTMGMVVPEIANPFFPMMIEATERHLQRRGLILLLCDAQDDPDVEARRVNALLERQVDGLIISPCHAERSRETILGAAAKLPVVQLDRHVEGSVTDWVGSDDEHGIGQIVAHLEAAGARSFVFVSSLPTSSSARLRTAAYRRATAAIDPASADRILAGEFTSDWGQQATRQLLADGGLPDAIVCGSDTVAFGVLHELHAQGIRVPEQVMVTGYDDVGLAFMTYPSLTTVRQPCDEIAARSIALLYQRLNGVSPSTLQHVNVPPSLMVRGSTRAVARPSRGRVAAADARPGAPR